METLSPCPKHPKYEVKRKPTSDCAHCLALWNAKNLTSDVESKCNDPEGCCGRACRGCEEYGD